MFLLLLIGLGTAGVKAQVRIGGNGAPNAAAVLDLNADDSTTPVGNKGALALPRVSLTDTLAQLNGATPVTGMLVYNTNATIGVGIYYWNGRKWVLGSLPSTIKADSGKLLMSNGTTLVAAPGFHFEWIPKTLTAAWAGASIINFKTTLISNAMCTWTAGSPAIFGGGYVTGFTVYLNNHTSTVIPNGTSVSIYCFGQGA